MGLYELTRLLLQADPGPPGGDPVGEASPAANGQPQAVESQDPTNMFLVLAIILAIFWIVVFRPESRRRKEREKKVRGVQKGDSVITTGGILGKVWKVEDKHVVLVVDKEKDFKIQMLKSSIFEIVPAEGAEAPK